MIKKIIKISGIGRYYDYKINKKFWNSELTRFNVIYGENGSGKTTLTLIFRSLKGKDLLILKKKSFGFIDNPEIELLDSANTLFSYKNNRWNKYNLNIEVFDTHFIEENIYTGSSHLEDSQHNLFEIIVGEEGVGLRKQLEVLLKIRDKNRKKRKNIKNRIRMRKGRLGKGAVQFLNKEIDELNDHYKVTNQEIKLLMKKLGEYSKHIFGKYIGIINQKLRNFTPYIEIKKFSSKLSKNSQILSYYLLVNGHQVVFHDSRFYPSVKYTLSEGDKSAIALSFFLAKLYYHEGDLAEKIIIFDDPISSFDLSRKNATIKSLVELSQKCKQLIILTHDINFAKDISKSLNHSELTNLKIVRKGSTNTLILQDIEKETLASIFKDIDLLNHYLNEGANNELEKREVIRCMRPILEGVLRIKFYKNIMYNEWLGDIIKKISISTENNALFRLRILLDEIIELNDYTKSYHHSNPTQMTVENINDEELRNYVNRTLGLIDKI